MAAAVLVSLLYAGIAVRNGGFTAPTPLGYYGLMTEGLAHGHLHMMAEPDPRLAKLANPWAAYQGIPRMHDATYFHGHYYLYFGVAPILLLFWPWHALFGSYLSEGFAAVVFGYIGFLAGLLVLRAWVRLRPVGPWWQALGVLVWGLATYVAVDMQGAEFYAVPILCAFMCVTLALVAVLGAVQAGAARRASAWIAAASLAWGLSVASRPHYVLSLPCLVIPVLWLCWNRWKQSAERLQLLAAALVPAGLVGTGLAWYNYARFGSVSEFGFRYQFTASDQRFIRIWNPGLIPGNLHSYLLQGMLHTIYFPFVTPTSDMVGILAWTPLAILAPLLYFTFRSKAVGAEPAWSAVGRCALWAGLIHLLALSILPIGTNRYDADFDPEFILCALGVGAFFLASRQTYPRLVARLGTLALALLAVVSLVQGSLLSLQRTSAPVFSAAERAANSVVALLHLESSRSGGVAFSANLAAIPNGDVPLVTTGTGGDQVFARRVDASHLSIGFVHAGNLAVIGAPFTPRTQGLSAIRVDMGVLCPPVSMPALRGWDPEALDILKHAVVVTVDGEVRLHTHSNFYTSDPLHVWLGADAYGVDGERLPGGITDTSLTPLTSSDEVLATGWRGPVRLHLKFPGYSVDYSDPLISSGRDGEADMIYVTYLGPGLMRIGHDGNHLGALETDPIAYDPTQEHVLDVDLGALDMAGSRDEKVPANFSLRFDGKWILNAARASHPTMPAEVVFGFNSHKLSTAKESFSGPVLWPEAIRTFARRSVDLNGHGPLAVSAQFSPMPKNTIEALLTLGVPGHADLFVLRFLDPQTIEMSIDHWGIGMVTSKPITVDPQKIYSFEFSSAAFLPPLGDPAWKGLPLSEQKERLGKITVSVNGEVVLTGPWPGYTASLDQVHVGKNPLGGSMDAGAFVGSIVEAHRPWDEKPTLGYHPAK